MRRVLLIGFASLLLSARGGCGGGGGSSTTTAPPASSPDGGSSNNNNNNMNPTGGHDDTGQARIVRAMQDVEAILTAVERARDDIGLAHASCLENLDSLMSSRTPTDCGNLQTCAQTGYNGDLCWGGPYLNSVMVDPWGTSYRITVDAGLATVGSAGPDGTFETGDDITRTG